ASCGLRKAAPSPARDSASASSPRSRSCMAESSSSPTTNPASPLSSPCRAVPPEVLASRIAALPESPGAAAAIERLQEAADAQGERANLDAVLAEAKVASFLGNALGDCPYLLDLAAKDVARLVAMLGDDSEARIARINAELAETKWATRSEAMPALRRAKQDVALTLGLADLGVAIGLETVTALLTAFADAALAAALRF